MSLLFGAGDRLGDYRIEALLGRGGMGVVYRAWQESVGRAVALKVLPPAAGERAIWRLRREARLLARLQHPGLIRVFDAGLIGTTPYYAMELIEGQTLGAVLAACPSRAADRERAQDARILSALSQVAEALACAHAAGIVHRDVKPGNILLSRERTLLGDFGLAFDSNARELTATGELAGTPYYMSPEQVRGGRVDHRSDVYSLGVVLYEALSGAHPFAAPTTAAVLRAIETQTPVDLRRLRPDLSADLLAVVGKAMARDAAERYQSAGALATDLRAVVRGEPVSASPPGLGRRARVWMRREPWRVVALLVIAATLLGLLAMWRQFHRAIGAEGQRAEVALAEMERLALGVQIDRAEEASRPFAVVRPEQAEAMRAWLRDDAQPLIDQIEPLRRFVQTLRARALAYGEADAAADRATHPQAQRLFEIERAMAEFARILADEDAVPAQRRQARINAAVFQIDHDRLALEVGKRRTWRFERAQEQLLHDQAAALLQRLEAFATGDDGTVARVRAQLEWTEFSRQRCFVDGADAWRRATAAVAGDARYAGLCLPPQTDLLPIGRDPDSGLFEFVHLRSGERGHETPARDEAGRIVPDESMGIVFVLLPGGEATLGAQATDPGQPDFDADAKPQEGPVYRVRLAPFLLGKYEVTRGQWGRITGDYPSKRYGYEYMHEKERPVDSVSLQRARTVLGEFGLMLPTEAQWEYACRAGTQGPYHFGDRAAAPGFANFADRQVMQVKAPWAYEPDLDDGFAVSAPVGSFAANGFGLHDMHGNIGEWCDDPFARYVRPTYGDEGRHRLTTADGTSFVRRGGGFDELLEAMRSATRLRDPAGAAGAYTGLRAARRLETSRP